MKLAHLSAPVHRVKTEHTTAPVSRSVLWPCRLVFAPICCNSTTSVVRQKTDVKLCVNAAHEVLSVFIDRKGLIRPLNMLTQIPVWESEQGFYVCGMGKFIWQAEGSDGIEYSNASTW